MLNLKSASLFCLIGLLLPLLAFAEAVGTVTHAGGVVRATRTDGTSRILGVKSEVLEGDTLRTEKNTYVRIKFVDDAEIVLRPDTVFKVNAYSYRHVPVPERQDNILFSLIKGGLRSVTGLLGKRSPNKFKMNTVVATIGIRGTHFGALLCNDDCANITTISGQMPKNGLHTDTAQGITYVSNKAGSVDVPAGAFSYTADANTPPRLVEPADGVQVTMPESISDDNADGNGLGPSDGNTCTVD